MSTLYEARVLGVDPGATVGLFYVHVAYEKWPTSSEVRSDFQAWQLDRAKAAAVIELQLREHPETFVAVERYVITQKTAKLTQQPAALEFIGIVRQLCDKSGSQMVTQMKSDVSRMARNTVLKELGWWQAGKDHANDAARHALFGLSGHNPRVFHALMTRGRITTSR